jgi:hypothetical protein
MFLVHHPNGKTMTFCQSDQGLFYADIADVKGPDGLALVNTVAYTAYAYSHALLAQQCKSS